jgi:two-component system chemotaxis response regulator CheB
MALPSTTPGIVIAQHMPEHFTASLAQRLDQLCALEVREAKEGDRLGPGLALIAPGDHHLVLVKGGPGYAVRLRSGPKVHYQRPSVDVLFESVAGVAGPAAVGVLLTGMGSDGAAGLLSMKERGARTVVEAESSCVVFGMPKEAIELGAADEVASLLDMPSAIYRALEHIEPAGSTWRSPGKGQTACTRHARN